MAILGNVADTCGAGGAYTAAGDVDPIHFDRSTRRCPDPGDRLHQLGLAVAIDTGQRDDLHAPPRLGWRRTHGFEAAIVKDAQILHLENGARRFCVALVDTEDHVAPDHHPGQ